MPKNGKNDWRSVVQELPAGNFILKLIDWKAALFQKVFFILALLVAGLSYAYFSKLLSPSLKASVPTNNSVDTVAMSAPAANVMGNQNQVQITVGHDSPIINQTMSNSPNSLQVAGNYYAAPAPKQEYNGVLTPADEPDPVNFDAPKDAVKIFLGDLKSYVSGRNFQHYVLMVGTNPVLWLRRTNDGLYFSADLFRENDRSVVKIRDNNWTVNPNNYYVTLTNTSHELLIADKSGILLKCDYLNENAIQIQGHFQFINYPDVTIKADTILIGNQRRIAQGMISADCFVDLWLNMPSP